jgi:hypothetical protein
MAVEAAIRTAAMSLVFMMYLQESFGCGKRLRKEPEPPLQQRRNECIPLLLDFYVNNLNLLFYGEQQSWEGARTGVSLGRNRLASASA